MTVTEIPTGFGLYNVPKAKSNPKLITHETAKELKAKPFEASAEGESGSEEPTTVKAILAAVGDDPEKAAVALEAENAREDGPRSSLVTKLQSVVDAAGDEDQGGV